jgi:hypothetical protein
MLVCVYPNATACSALGVTTTAGMTAKLVKGWAENGS